MLLGKRCISCCIVKDILEYEWDDKRPSPRSKCKYCRHKESYTKLKKEKNKIYAKKRRKENPRAVKNNYIKSVYGINIEQYDELLKKQENRCCICKKYFDVLYIDHCHKNKNVRGLLCNICNFGLGSFKDNVEYLKNAIKYLEKNKI